MHINSFCKHCDYRKHTETNTEAKYFNEANWCRLYKRELWNGIRFPEGMYAQDVMVAGKLYSRMSKVADVNHILYFWLQSPESVTHNERSFKFFHDNVIAGVSNFNFAINNGILPKAQFLYNDKRSSSKRMNLQIQQVISLFKKKIQLK